MKITDAQFLKSAADRSGFMTFNKPVIAICGRSNVGKSSFINMLANRKKLAKTSREPGRTRLINYFDFGKFAVADLPGYGFAQVSKGEKMRWARTIEQYFADAQNVTHAFVLLDIRHDPTADDINFINYLNHYIIPFTVICTKCDKLSKTRIKPALKQLADRLAMGADNLIAISNENGYGKDAVLSRLDVIVNAYKVGGDAVDVYDEDEEDGETLIDDVDGENVQ